MASDNTHLLKTLETLGLSEKEAKVYFVLLQLGASTPYKLSKRSGLKRPTAYVIADELVEKGYAVKAKGDKHTYIARPPEVIYEEREQKMQEAKKNLPELQALKGGVADKPSVLYFEGYAGLKQALMYGLRELHGGEIVGFYANPDFTTKESHEASLEFNDYRVAHNITIRGLLTDTGTLKDFEKYIQNETFTSKFVPKETYSSNASFEFFPNFVKIIFFDTSVAVIIESPTVAKAMRQIFEMLWSRLGTEYDKSRVISGGKSK
ncbi:MAG: TrmB family transcriptional regulator [Minisyncoccota bacterium]